MIAFLTLCYVAILATLVWLKVIKLNLWWKLSPVLFMLVCLVLFIIPMQWGAPTGTVNVYQGVVEIVPNVSGEVLEVHAKPEQPMKQGEVLFAIDPRPYQAEVTRLEAAIKDAEQAAKMLPMGVATAKSAVIQAEAALVEAKQDAESLSFALAAAEATVAKYDSQRELSQAMHDRSAELLQRATISQEEFETTRRNLDAAKATLLEAKANLEKAQLAYDSRIGGVHTSVIQAEEALRAAQAAETQARLALESTIDGENTLVAQLRTQLEVAKLNLEWTTVRAPADGYPMGLSLRPGQRVGNIPARGWVTYVESGRTRLAVGIEQNVLRHVKPGQRAEIILKLYPGRTFGATVDSIAHITPEGQLQAGGTVPVAPTRQTQRLPYGVVLEMDDTDIDPSELPGGAAGSAAIYTESARLTHIIRRVELRMYSWLNYIFP